MKTTSKCIKRLLAVLIAISLTLSYATVAMAAPVEGTTPEEMMGLVEEQEGFETLEEEVGEDTTPEETSELKK